MPRIYGRGDDDAAEIQSRIRERWMVQSWREVRIGGAGCDVVKAGFRLSKLLFLLLLFFSLAWTVLRVMPYVEMPLGEEKEMALLTNIPIEKSGNFLQPSASTLD